MDAELERVSAALRRVDAALVVWAETLRQKELALQDAAELMGLDWPDLQPRTLN